MKKKLSIGIVAHVDAGKTTLSEAFLYVSGKIRKMGRVDHKDAYLDTYELERARGITIFSKQARFTCNDVEFTLLDTPGHVDFSAEMERTLQVLDYAILIISGPDGIQGHTLTLWKLLEQYRIPTFIFVNKMDMNVNEVPAGADPGEKRSYILKKLQEQLSESCVCFHKIQEDPQAFYEEAAMSDEQVMNQYLETGIISKDEIIRLIKERKMFPCHFGSALKLEGITAFLDSIAEYTKESYYPDTFGARVFKITRDPQGNRLTHLKITGGSLKCKQMIGKKGQEEKIDQIRLYSGNKFEMADILEPGMVCAVTGPIHTMAGQGLGWEEESHTPVLEPVLSYRIGLPKGCDVHGMFLKLKQLEEEEPMLRLVWEEALSEIHVRVMGEVQIEILKSLIRERFQTEVTFDEGNIVYKETIKGITEGVGHYEPLRHYAEVHLLLEEGERGSGIVLRTKCSEDALDGNWQRLILTHLMEKPYRGVLTGSYITDIKITLVAGKAHLKHTEGGDFRQATYRAVRQGLKKAESVLLEPVYAFRLEIPSDCVGRAMTDIQRMGGSFENPMPLGDMTLIEGSAPVITMRNYAAEVASYARGRGRLTCTLKGYEECHNTEEVCLARGYDSELDLSDPTGSVFCAHGAGFYVPWDEVESYMHIESVLKPKKETYQGIQPVKERVEKTSGSYGQLDKELEEIFFRTYGNTGKSLRTDRSTQSYVPPKKTVYKSTEQKKIPIKEEQEEYLLVDGYNIIFSWDELKELAKDNLAGARGRLMDILSAYQGFRKQTLILVFDAYKVSGGTGKILKYHNIHVVYTKEAETADQYIEKTVHKIGRNHKVTVATSDGLEQIIILGQGAYRMSAKGLKEEIMLAGKECRELWEQTVKLSDKRYLFDEVTKEDAEKIANARLGKKELFE